MAWGPWIDHDGKGCPCLGQLVQYFNRGGASQELIAGSELLAAGLDPNGAHSAWVWTGNPLTAAREIVRYRVHKPKGMEILEQIVKTTKLPKKCKEPVSA